MKKRFLLALLLTLPILLSACGSSEDETPSEPSSNLKIFENEEISIKYPTDWEIILPKDFTVEVPVGTIVAFRNSVRNDAFTANISIVKNNLPAERASIDYAKGLIQKHAKELLNYKELGRNEVKISTGVGEFDTLVTHFSGKENDDADTKEFLQASVVELKTAYIVTGAYLLGEDEGVKKIIEQSINTFRAK